MRNKIRKIQTMQISNRCATEKNQSKTHQNLFRILELKKHKKLSKVKIIN